MRRLTIVVAGLALILPIAASRPAFAAERSCTAFCVAYTQPISGNNSGPPTSTPGTPPTPSVPGTPGKPPGGCSAIWAKYSGEEHLIAWCRGPNAKQDMLYYTTQKPSCPHGLGICAGVVPVPGHSGTPGTPPVQVNPQSGIPTQLLAVFDSLQVPTPKIAGMYPDPTNSDGSGNPPYLYTDLPTQVAVDPSSLPPTLTSSHTTSTVSTVNTTWDAAKNKWNTKQITTTLTATITATLQGTMWIPEAAYVNSMLNVAVPTGETQGQFPGSVLCGPGQNELNAQLNNNLPNPGYCFIDFTQPSTKSGYYIHAFAQYSGQGTITENGSVVWSGFLGYRFSDVPASVQAEVAVVEAVRCSTAACYNAGLAASDPTIVPWGPETP